MNYFKGDFWKIWEDYDAVVCPTNQIVKKNGALVMGGGLAKEFATRFPQLPFIWGKAHSKEKMPDIVFTKLPGIQTELVAFPSKTHWRYKLKLDLIIKSMVALKENADSKNLESILLPKIGCGLGGLNWDREVLPAVS